MQVIERYNKTNTSQKMIHFINFPFSDPDGVIITLKVGETGIGPGVWQMKYVVYQLDLFKK